MKAAPPQDEIDRFLATGEYDLLFLNWPGQNIVDKAQRGSRILADALAAEVRRRAEGIVVRTPDALRGTDTVAFARTKVAPMVRGLLPGKEQDPVLALLERSLVFLTPETIEPLIQNERSLSTARLAVNVYLDSIGADAITKDVMDRLGCQRGNGLRCFRQRPRARLARCRSCRWRRCLRGADPPRPPGGSGR